MKKIIATLLCIALVLSASVSAVMAIDTATATYYAGETVVKTESLTVGGTYTPENFMLDSQYIPDGYYFTGWYTDAACTTPVKVADLTKEITVTGDFVRYAGLSKYETEFSPVLFSQENRPNSVESLGTLYVLQYPIVRDEGFTNYISSNGNLWMPTMTKDGNDTIFSYNTATLGVFIFHDENGKVYKAKPGATYKITYEYKFTTTNEELGIYPNIGYPKSYISASSSSSAAVQGYRLTGSANAAASGASKGQNMTTSATEWTSYEAVLVTPDASSNFYPFFYIRNNGKASDVQIKNIKVQELIPEELSVVYNYKNADGTPAQRVVTEGITLGDNYDIDFLAPNTNTQFFADWYSTADCSGNPISTSSTQIVNNGVNNLYAKYKDYPTKQELILPGSGASTTLVNIPVITNAELGVLGTDKVAKYFRNANSSIAYITSSTYNASTNTTDFVGNMYGVASAHILTDTDGNFYAAQPGKRYKLTFEATSGNGSTKVQLGVGVPGTNFQLAWGNVQWNRSANGGSGYNDMLYKSGEVLVGSGEFKKYVTSIAVPEDYPTDDYNFFGLRIYGTGNNGTLSIRNIVVEEYIPEPISVVYNYKNADGTPAQKVVSEGINLGDNYAIDFLAPNTETQFFADWYLTEDFSGEPISSSKVAIAVEGANNLYAKYKDYPVNQEMILPGSGASSTLVNMPIITNPEIGSQATDKVAAYRRQVNSSIPFIQSSTYNAETNETEFLVGPSGAAVSAHILTDKDGNFVAGKPGATYKVTFWAKTTSSFKISFGAGIPNTHFQLFFGGAQWYRAPNQGSGYNELSHKSLEETISSKAYTEYTLMLTIPENYPKTEYNFLGLRFRGVSKNTSIYIKDMVVYEVDINAPEEMFVTFENYTNFSKNAYLDETNKYIIAKNIAEYTAWENADLNGVWANPSKTEKIYTVFGGTGFSPKNFAITNGGMNSEKALKFKQTVSGTAFKVADISNGVHLKDNTTYTATFYYKAEGESNKDLKFSILNALNNEKLGMVTAANTVVIPASNVASEWTKVTLTFTTDFGYHNADYAISKEMFCIPVICVNHDIDDTARTVYIDNVKLETSINCGGVSVLTAQAEAKEKAQALRVYFNYTPDQNGEITIGGETVSVVKRGVLLAYAPKVDYQTDSDGNYIREKIETPNVFVKENVGSYGIISAEKAENLTDCWANENGVLTYSTYIKNFEVDDEKEIAVRGYIELSDGRIIYSEIYNYSVNDIKAVNQLGTEKTYYDFTKQEVYEKLVLQGNSKVLETGITSDWNSQTIKFKANCVGDVTVRVHNPLGTEVHFKVIVDGNRVTGEFRPVGVDAEKEISEFTFNVGYKAGVKEIQIARMTEVTGGPTEIMGVEFIGELLDAEEAETLIEFIGDSITCGLGNGGNVSDGTRTYAYLTVQNLGVDFRIRSRSGSGFKTDSGGGQGIGGCWPLTYGIDSYIRSTTTPYSISRQADVVCIYLGTNDYTANSSKPVEERNAYFVQGMKELIDIIKEYNPNGKFVWITGGMTNGYKDAAITAMNDLGGEDAGYFVCQLPSGLNAGAAGHPDYDQHVLMAEILSEFLTEKGLVK